MNVPLHPSMKNVGGGRKNVKKLLKITSFLDRSGKTGNHSTVKPMPSCC